MQLQKLWSDLKSSLWFRPTLWVVALTLLAVGLTAVDRQWSLLEGTIARSWLIVGGVQGARTMLGSIGSAMLTVISLTFSIMMVAVVQTANTYSPRILRQYLGDSANQNVLGILIGTFLFTLLVLRGVRDQDDFVPLIATNFSLLLSLFSVGALIYFINHVSHSIKVNNIVAMVLENAMENLEPHYPAPVGESCWLKDPELPPSSAIIWAAESGYLDLVDAQPLLQTLKEADAVIGLEPKIGAYVLAGTPLATVWPAEAHSEGLAQAVRESLLISQERTMTQDPFYGFQQLSDIGIRALSPAINDPETTINVINATSSLLLQWLQCEPVSRYRCDEEGRLRVITHMYSLTDVLDEAFGQIRRYSRGDVDVLARLIEVYGEISRATEEVDIHDTLWEFVERTLQTAERDVEAPVDRQTINTYLRRTAEILGRDPTPLLLRHHGP
jgi:uncharacterized membrane protein